jgi:fatty-acyl-CoA synthase
MIETNAASAYHYPLLIKHLWHTPLNSNPDQQIVSGESKRFSYIDLYNRVTQLASGLTELGLTAGDTIAVMDWDKV